MTLEEIVLGAVPVTTCLGALETVVMAHVSVLEDTVLVAKTAVGANGVSVTVARPRACDGVAQATLATLLRLFAERAALRATKPAVVMVK